MYPSLPEDYLARVDSASGPLFEVTADIMRRVIEPTSSDGTTTPALNRSNVVHHISRNGHTAGLSVIIPTFNRPDLLAGTVGSVCRQNRISVHIVIVDDCGTDVPEAVLDQLAASPHSATVVRHHRNLGLGASRNTGASIAGGSWLMMLDDDDTLVDGSIELLLEAADADPAAEFIFGDAPAPMGRSRSPVQS